MSEIECVRAASAGSLLDGYLKKLIKEAGNEAKLIDWENPKIGHRSPLILLADNEHIESTQKIISTRNEKVIIALNSRKDFKRVTELKTSFDKIFGFIDLTQEIEYNVPVLLNYLNINFTQQAVSLHKLANDLDKVYEFTKSELTRIKDLHDRFVKVRVDQFKGANLTSKFMAGEKSGGEFFDVIQNDQELLFIQAGSDSYLMSSILIAEIESIKERSAISNLQTLRDQFLKIITQHATENKADLTYCMMKLNLKTLQASFTLKGSGHIYYQGELISFNQPMKLKLRPKDRLCVISEGSMRNWEILSKLSIEKFFVDNQSMNTRDLINEFFFEVSRNKAGSFLIYDALIAVIDIEESVLYQLS